MRKYSIAAEATIANVSERLAGRIWAAMKFEHDKDGYAEISCKVRGDGLWSVLKVLRHFQYNGDVGHSYSSTLDTDNSEYRMSVGWDGDGSDGIKDLKVNGKKLDTKQFDKDQMKWGKREANIAARLVAAAHRRIQ